MIGSALKHLPVLQVVIPLLVAALCVLVGNRTLARAAMLLTSAVMFLVSLMLAGQVYPAGVISYELGGWPPPGGSNTGSTC